MNYSVIIPAAGSGKRMGLGFNKIFAEIGDTPIIIKTMKIFDQPSCEKIIVVYQKDDYQRLSSEIDKYEFDTKITLVEGGAERLNSVYNGLKHVESDYVLIHDGARPYLSNEALNRVISKLSEVDACLLMVKSKDTIKVVCDGVVIETPSRNAMYMAQTPQAFKTSLIKECYDIALDSNNLFTDDASIVEACNKPVYVVEGEYSNIKITTKEDLM